MSYDLVVYVRYFSKKKGSNFEEVDNNFNKAMNSNGKIARKKGSYLYWFLVIWILLFVKSFIFWPTLDTLKRFLSTGSFMFSTKFQFFLFFIRFFYYKNQITTGTTK